MIFTLRSKKGIETAPLFFIFTAVVLVLTAAVVFPYFSEWERIMNEGKARKEAIKLQEAINEISAMGDVGSSEELHLDIPPGFSLMFDIQNNIQVSGPTANYAGNDFKGLYKVDGHIDPIMSEIKAGSQTIMIIYGDPNSYQNSKQNHIYVVPG